MIRQIRRLTRPVPALGPGVSAIAVYARERDGRFVQQSAAEQGYEGVACVDDAARAANLYTEIWRRHRFDWARTEAEGLLRFTCAMQVSGGAFVNFIGDWDGRKQLDGPTSRAGGGPWQARAMHAIACGFSAFGDERYADAFNAGLAILDRPMPYLDVRAVHILAALEFWRTTRIPDLAPRVLAWAGEMAAARIGDMLPDLAGEANIHLWGHLQEAALARAGIEFGRDDLVRAAAASADAVLVPAAERAFAGSRSLAFDVSCTVAGLDAVAAATNDTRYSELAAAARAWFDGRNAAAAPVYDRERGCVYDGIDGDQINPNSGAESNIEGGLALIDSLPWAAFAAEHVRETTA